MYVATDIQAVLLQGESFPSGRNSFALIAAHLTPACTHRSQCKTKPSDWINWRLTFETAGMRMFLHCITCNVPFNLGL